MVLEDEGHSKIWNIPQWIHSICWNADQNSSQLNKLKMRRLFALIAILHDWNFFSSFLLRQQSLFLAPSRTYHSTPDIFMAPRCHTANCFHRRSLFFSLEKQNARAKTFLHLISFKYFCYTGRYKLLNRMSVNSMLAIIIQ